MGRTHVLAGTVLGSALAPVLAPVVLGHPLDLAEYLSFTAITCGFSVWPDFDHPQATLARTLGPVTKAIATGICKVSGGHRKGTHTIWFAAIMIGLVMGATALFGRNAQLAFAFVGFYLCLMILRIAVRHGRGLGEFIYVVEAAGATAAAWHWVDNWDWLPWAVGMGVIWHICADILTVEGVPVIYPLAKHTFVKLPILGHTDSWREHLFAAVLAPVACWLIFATAFGHDWWTFAWLANPSGWQLAL